MNFKVRGKVNTKPLKEAKYDPDGDFEEYDMFVFITNLFTRDLKEPEKLPLNPLGRKYKHFEYSSREGDSTYSPFAVDTDGNIVIGALKREELDDVKEICNLYKFDYSEREAKRSNGAPVYYLTIVVPTYSRGEVPMSVDDYFESIGIPLEQVVSKWYLDNKAKFERDLVGVRESIDNLKRAIDGKEIDPAAALGVTMATAYNDSEDADKEVEKRMEAHKKETGIDYSKPFTGTAKSGETKKVSTPSLKKMHLSESLFEDAKSDEDDNLLTYGNQLEFKDYYKRYTGDIKDYRFYFDSVFCVDGKTNKSIPKVIANGKLTFKQAADILYKRFRSTIESEPPVPGFNEDDGSFEFDGTNKPVGIKNEIKSATILDGVERIPNNVFSFCSNLRSISIPNSVTTIDGGAFNRSGLKGSIYIPSSVKRMGDWVFEFCNLTDIYCGAARKPSGWDKGWKGVCHAKVHWGVEPPVSESLKETQRNYPKCFEESITEATHKLDGGYIDLEAEDEDFENAFSKFLSEVGADRIPDATSYREHGWIYMYFLLNGEKEEFCYHASNDNCDATLNGKYVAKSKAGDTLDNIIKIYNAKKSRSKRESKSLSEAYTSQEANQILDTFLSYVDEGIIDTKEALLSLIRWLSIYEAAEFIKVNDYVPDDDLYEGCRKSKGKKSLKEWSEIDDFMDDHYDTYDVACRFLDIEIPDVCSDVLAKLGDRDNAMNLSTASLNNIVKKCRRFYDEMERAAK